MLLSFDCRVIGLLALVLFGEFVASTTPCRTHLAVDPFTPLPWRADEAGTLVFCNEGDDVLAWDFGDGGALETTAGGVQTVSHAYAAAGLYRVQAYWAATDEDGQVQLLSWFGSADVLVQDCAGHYDSGRGGLQLTVVNDGRVDTATPAVLMLCRDAGGQFAADTTFRWAFGDGTLLQPDLMLSMVAHRYHFTGSYAVDVLLSDAAAAATTLLVADGNDGGASCASSGIDMSSAMQVGRAELLVYCAQTGHGPPLLLDWYFGDGSDLLSTSQQIVRHSYAAAGAYLVDVAARYADGSTALLTDVARVLDCPSSSSTTSVVVSGAPVAAHTTLLQLCLGSDDQLPTELLFHWIFGDGSASTPSVRGLLAEHVYRDAGRYAVECRALLSTDRSVWRTWRTAVVVAPASSSSPAPPSQSPTDQSLSAWQVFAVTVACLLAVLLVVLLALLAFVLHRRHSRTRLLASSDHRSLIADSDAKL